VITLSFISSVRRAALAMAIAGAAGCVGDPAALSSPNAPDTIMSAVQISPAVAVVSVGGTQQFTIAGTTLAGTPFTAFDSVVYSLNTLSDTARATITPDGMLRGTGVSTAAVLVNVLAYQRGAIRFDQALVQVTAAVVPVTALSIQPVAPDSAKLSSGIAKSIVPRLWNPVTNESVANPVMQYRVSPADAQKVALYFPTKSITTPYGGYTVQTSRFIGSKSISPTANQIVPLVSEGSVWIYGAVTAYGTPLKDSVLYTFTYPYTATVTANKTNLELTSLSENQIVTLMHGATVTFTNGVAGTDPLTIAFTFSDSTAATAASPAATTGGASGNVTALRGGQSSTRVFATPGTYTWTAAAAGQAPWEGQVVHGTLVIK